MKKISKSFPMLVTILTLSSSLAWAQPVQPRPDVPPHEFAGGNPREDIMEQLGLSEEQKGKLKEHKFKYDIINMEINNKIEVLKRKLQYELTKKTMDKINRVKNNCCMDSLTWPAASQVTVSQLEFSSVL